MPDEERKKTRPQFVIARNRSEWPLSNSRYASTFHRILGIATHRASKPHGRCSSDFEDRFLHRFGSVHISRRSHCREQLEIKYSGGSYWKRKKKLLPHPELYILFGCTFSQSKHRAWILWVQNLEATCYLSHLQIGTKLITSISPLPFGESNTLRRQRTCCIARRKRTAGNELKQVKKSFFFVCLPDAIYTSLDSAECTQEKNEKQGASTVECPLRSSSSSPIHLLSTQMQHKHTPKAPVTPISLLITQEPDHFIQTL